MVAHLFALILLIVVTCLPALGAEGRQQCLECHRGHYAGQGKCTVCHRGNPASLRRNIAHHGLIAGRFARFTLKDDAVVREGNRLLEQFSCRRCHVTGGRGNRLAANLDGLYFERNPEELAAAIRNPALGMPDFRVSDQQTVALVNAILAGGQSRRGVQGDQPNAVHFDADGDRRKDVFSRKCGACHRVLTKKRGAVGQGGVGPNLSGLLSRWYPKTFRDGGEWNRKRLEEWLRNPRRVRNQARMQPVELTAAELDELVELLRTDQD